MVQQGTGFLCVFAEPGSLVSLDEFQDWYNNEHVPLRLNNLPSFLTGARYSSLDSQRPSWIALYDIDDPKTFSDASYTRLRANRSPREADLVKRLEILDRRTCKLALDSGVPAEDVSTSLAAKNPTKTLVTHGFQSLEGGSFEELKRLDEKGWIRSRVFECYDNLTTGVGKDLKAEVPTYLAVHEIANEALADEAVFKEAVQSLSPSASIEEFRKWTLYKAYPCVAQGNLP